MKLTQRVLYNKAKSCSFQYPFQNKRMADEMFDFMEKNHGIGLAAPQIGRALRMFVIDAEGFRDACFNPEITDKSDKLLEFDEGCLSFPGQHCIITRPDWVTVRYQTTAGEWQQKRLSGLAARCFQHELDHLDGVTMWDRYKEQNAEQS